MIGTLFLLKGFESWLRILTLELGKVVGRLTEQADVIKSGNTKWLEFSKAHGRVKRSTYVVFLWPALTTKRPKDNVQIAMHSMTS